MRNKLPYNILLIDHKTAWMLFCLMIFACNTNHKKSENQRTSNREEQKSMNNHVITVKSAADLMHSIQSNQVIHLLDQDYFLPSSLHITDIKNLTLQGSGNTRIFLENNQLPVIGIAQSENINLIDLTVSQTESDTNHENPVTLNMVESKNIILTNCTISGSRAIGLVTKNVEHLSINQSEFTGCHILLFDFSNSKEILVTNTNFHTNLLAASCLGGFTDSTSDVTFIDCSFTNNIPKQPGNPAFNFNENYDRLEKTILFQNCTFENNKGFKWYGDKIKLENCAIESSGFIGM